jgi:hypothetical protein
MMAASTESTRPSQFASPVSCGIGVGDGVLVGVGDGVGVLVGVRVWVGVEVGLGVPGSSKGAPGVRS